MVINGLTDEYKLVSGNDGSGFSITNSLSGILEHKKLKKDDLPKDYELIDEIHVPATNDDFDIDNKVYDDVNFGEFLM